MSTQRETSDVMDEEQGNKPVHSPKEAVIAAVPTESPPKKLLICCGVYQGISDYVSLYILYLLAFYGASNNENIGLLVLMLYAAIPFLIAEVVLAVLCTLWTARSSRRLAWWVKLVGLLSLAISIGTIIAVVVLLSSVTP